jgi:hypothetical protein
MAWKSFVKARTKSTAELARLRVRSVQTQASPKAMPLAAGRLAGAGGAGAGQGRRPCSTFSALVTSNSRT